METLVVVDIQPAYAEKWPHVNKVMQTINNHHGNIILFVNEELTNDTMEEIKLWWLDHGLEERILDTAIINDKGYGVLRDWMDSGIDTDTIIETLQYMQKNNIYITEDIDTSDPNLSDSIIEAIESDCGHIHSYFIDDDIIKTISDNYLICGGSKHECLAEVEIYLASQNKKAIQIDHLIYDGDYSCKKQKTYAYY